MSFPVIRSIGTGAVFRSGAAIESRPTIALRVWSCTTRPTKHEHTQLLPLDSKRQRLFSGLSKPRWKCTQAFVPPKRPGHAYNVTVEPRVTTLPLRSKLAFRSYSKRSKSAKKPQKKPETDKPEVEGTSFGWIAVGIIIFVGFVICFVVFYIHSYGHYHTRRLMQGYLPFKLVRRDELSSNSAILTFVPAAGAPGIRRLREGRFEDEQLKWGLWSISLAKDDIMVERSYTPLPLSLSTTERPSQDPIDLVTKYRNGLLFAENWWRWDLMEISLYVRAMKGGEVSQWLHSLQPGEVVRMRGPDVDYNLQTYSLDGVAKLLQENTPPLDWPTGPTLVKQSGADANRVVVLAGGTGIATALQAAASTLAAKPHAKVDILWANRRREDVAADNPHGIMTLVQRLQRKYPGNLDLQVFVDEEKRFIGTEDILKVMPQDSTTESGKSVLVVCGSYGFVQYFTGISAPTALGFELPESSYVRGVLGSAGIPKDWRIVGLW